MKTLTIQVLVVGGLLAAGSLAQADHNKDCKSVHGKVTVVTENGVTVNDKLYKVGKTTRITKNGEVVKLEKLSPGDVVCLDTRGNDEIGSEVAAVSVLTAPEGAVVTEKEVVREKEKEKVREEKIEKEK